MKTQVNEILEENEEEADVLYYSWGYMPSSVGNFVRLNELIECVERMVEDPDSVEQEIETIRENNLLEHVVKPFQRNFTLCCKENKYNLDYVWEISWGGRVPSRASARETH